MLALLASQPARGDDAPPRSTSTVGMPARIDQLVLPGPELEARPIEDRRAPVVVRIVDAYPHGSAFRYDLVYYGLEPGRYDLKDYLRRKDGSPAKDLPADPGAVEPVLPPGQVEPHPLALAPSPFLGGYRAARPARGHGLDRRPGRDPARSAGGRRAEAEAVASRPATLADRLRPLVDAAMAGKLSSGQHARARAAADRLLAQAARAGAGRAGRVHGRAPRPRGGRPPAPPARRLAAPAGRRPPNRSTSRPCFEPYQSIPADRAGGRGPGAGRSTASSGREPRIFSSDGATRMSFAYPAVLVLLIVPVLLIAWVWRRTSGRVALPMDHGGQPSGRGWAIASGPGRVGPGPDPGGGDRDPGRPAAIERPADQAGAHQHRVLRRYLQQHDQPARRRHSLRRLDEGDRSLPRHPQGRRVRLDVLRQQRAPLGPVDQRSLGDPLRTAVHEAGERPALDEGHDDRQGAPGLQGDPDRRARRGTA